MNELPIVDLVVILVYLAAVVGFGCWFVRKSGSTEEFMVAGRALPGWAVGLSLFGTYLSSNTFIAVPGKAYGSDWNAFVFSLSLPVAAWLAVKYFVPFYRTAGEISAYHHFEERFGLWARTFAVVCYLLTQFARAGSIMFGVSLALSLLTGWDKLTIILMAGTLITLYTMLGGIEAVIWTDVVQSIVLMVGAVAVLMLICLDMPAGPAQIIEIGMANNKLSLGSFDLSLATSTFWVVLLYGLFMNLNNFGIDQSFVQRYHTASSDREAGRSVWLAALMYVPISLLFFFIGTGLYAFYQTHPDELQSLQQNVAASRLAEARQSVDDVALKTEMASLDDVSLGDKAMPHFIVHGLPVGATGLLIAAIFAAAMSSIDTSLNSSATIILQDIYKRYLRPAASERESMVVLYVATLAMGACSTAIAIALIGVESLLDAWWTLSGIFAAGMLGLFLLGLMARHCTRPAAVTAVLLGSVAVLWVVLSPAWGEVSGTWSVEQGSRKLIGSETRLQDELTPGSVVKIDGQNVEIAHIDAERQIATLVEPYAGPSVENGRIHRAGIWYYLRSPFHQHMAIVVGVLTILLVGFALSPRGKIRESTKPAAS